MAQLASGSQDHVTSVPATPPGPSYSLCYKLTFPGQLTEPECLRVSPRPQFMGDEVCRTRIPDPSPNISEAQVARSQSLSAYFWCFGRSCGFPLEESPWFWERPFQCLFYRYRHKSHKLVTQMNKSGSNFSDWIMDLSFENLEKTISAAVGDIAPKMILMLANLFFFLINWYWSMCWAVPCSVVSDSL